MPATLPIGTVVDSGDIAELNAQRFNRHTFWCGQSGLGKTYALGVVLEQILAHTSLPLVILDPNADFVRLGEVRPEAASTGTAAALCGPRHPGAATGRPRRLVAGEVLGIAVPHQGGPVAARPSR